MGKSKLRMTHNEKFPFKVTLLYKYSHKTNRQLGNHYISLHFWQVRRMYKINLRPHEARELHIIYRCLMRLFACKSNSSKLTPIRKNNATKLCWRSRSTINLHAPEGCVWSDAPSGRFTPGKETGWVPESVWASRPSLGNRTSRLLQSELCLRG